MEFKISTIKNYFFQFIDEYSKVISLLLVLIISSIGFLSEIKPLYDKITSDIQILKTNNEMTLSEKNKTLELLNELVNNYHKIDTSDVAKIDKIIPEDPNFVSLMPQIEYIVLNNGFLIDKISVNEEKAADLSNAQGADATDASTLIDDPANHLKKIRVEIGVLGINYPGLKKLLTSLESNIRLIDINYLTFSPGDKTLELTFYTYYWKN